MAAAKRLAHDEPLQRPSCSSDANGVLRIRHTLARICRVEGGCARPDLPRFERICRLER
jgi:hypothetical protein